MCELYPRLTYETCAPDVTCISLCRIKKAGSSGSKSACDWALDSAKDCLSMLIKMLIKLQSSCGQTTVRSFVPQHQRRDAVRLILPAINIPSQEFLSNGAYLRIQLLFESLDTVSVEFLPCISRLQKVPGTNFITQWDVLVHLLLTYYSVTLLKTILSCRFIYLLHLPNSHQWICLRLITSSQIPIVIL